MSFYLKNLSEAERKNNPKKIDEVEKLIEQIRTEARQTSEHFPAQTVSGIGR